MGWQMDSHGKWKKTSGSGTKKTSKPKSTKKKGKSGSSGTKKKTSVDKGNTSATSKSIKLTTSNKENELKYAEEATFEMDGDYSIRRGCKINIRAGVASRWKGTWYVLETTHTIDGRGYKTEGKLGRVPYRESSTSSSSKKKTKKKSKKKSKSSGSKKKKSTQKKSAYAKSTKKKTSSQGKKWKMDSHGNWKKK